MARTTPNSGLKVWDAASDNFNPADLAFNWDALDTQIVAKVSKPTGIVSGETSVWNGTTWDRSSVTKLAAVNLTGYSAFTPSISASSGSPVIGNGIINSRYVQIGKLIHYYGQFTVGSTTNMGAGAFLISIPVVTNLSVPTMPGIARGFRASNFALATLMVYFGSASQIEFADATTYHGAETFVSGGASYPWAWVAGDSITWNTTYEAA